MQGFGEGFGPLISSLTFFNYVVTFCGFYDYLNNPQNRQQVIKVLVSFSISVCISVQTGSVHTKMLAPVSFACLAVDLMLLT